MSVRMNGFLRWRFFCQTSEKTRIIPVKDVIEPRVKVSGNGGIFPGFVSKVDMVGEGRTHVLKGAAVVTTGRIVGFQEGIIDMSGPGADYTYLQTQNIVICAEPVEGMHQHDHEHVYGWISQHLIWEKPVEHPLMKYWSIKQSPCWNRLINFLDCPRLFMCTCCRAKDSHDTYLTELM